MKRLAITTGDPAGIGPEIVASALRFRQLDRETAYLVYGQPDALQCGHEIIRIADVREATKPGYIYWILVGIGRFRKGSPSVRTGKAALSILERCATDLISGAIQAVVTAPVSKAHIRLVDSGFIGHTEFFAAKARVNDPVMSFRGEYFNLALLTTHVPLAEVPGQLNDEIVTRKLRLIWNEAQRLEAGARVALLGVDPHAGETGGECDAHLTALLQRLREDGGIDIAGPFPADSFFLRHAGEYRWIISASHDQGLIPFKMLHPHGVNVTVGLPFIRTSVDHGTAFEIAGKGKADEQSMVAAIDYAEKLLYPDKPRQTEPYSHFAAYYDRYMAHVAYDDWVELILQKFNRLRQYSPRHALELACGTAAMSCRLMARGIETDAADGCPEMLREAFRKPHHPHLFHADMLAQWPSESHDLVLLTFDSLNYLPEVAMIDTLLERVFSTLEKDGVFIFDISTLRNCREYFDGLINLESYPDCTMVHTSELDRSQKWQETRLQFFRRSGYTLRQYEEIHRQRIYRVAELLNTIKRSPFLLRGIWSPDEPENLLEVRPQRLDDLYTRLFFVLQKP